MDTADAPDTAGIFARESSYLGRYVQVGMAAEKVISVSFPVEPDADASAEHPVLDRIFAYLEGVEEEFRDVEVGLTVSSERRGVLDATREIPYGEQTTVRTLVRSVAGLDVDDDEDVELARAALAENPVPVLIPDHRVRDGASACPPEVEQRLRSLEGS
jgi:methylated-DNA-[protein]-cysteine S-methyltransferase